MKKLSKERYREVFHMLGDVSVNNVFAYSVLEGVQEGEVYVNNSQDIKSLIVQHMCGYSIFSGDINEPVIDELKDMLEKGIETSNGTIYLHVKDKKLLERMEELCQENTSIRKGKKISYRFNRSDFISKDEILGTDVKVKKMEEKELRGLEGYIVPKFSWSNTTSFLEQGVGFCVVVEGKVVSIAFSWFIGNGKVEIGVNTLPAFRKKGLARIVSQQMISYCIEHGLEPVWSCVKENISSQRLALSLGFEPEGEIYYYYVLRR